MSPNEFSIVQVANALSHFEEIAFATRQAPWDVYLAGDRTAIDENAKRGAFLFFGKARCVVCHEGPLYSDFEFHGIGVKNDGPGFNGSGDDQGRHYVTGRPSDRYKFRTPPLRNVTLTAPYFHNGTAPTLRDAVAQHVDPFRYADQYEESGAFSMNLAQIEAISPILEAKLRLSEDEVDLIIAFLSTMEDPGFEFVDSIIPASVPSGLPVSRLKARLVSHDNGG
jgi:cytochrome c peroxidase